MFVLEVYIVTGLFEWSTVAVGEEEAKYVIEAEYRCCCICFITGRQMYVVTGPLEWSVVAVGKKKPSMLQRLGIDAATYVS